MNLNSLTFQPLPIGARELSVQENHDVAGGPGPFCAAAVGAIKAFGGGFFAAAGGYLAYEFMELFSPF